MTTSDHSAQPAAGRLAQVLAGVDNYLARHGSAAGILEALDFSGSDSGRTVKQRFYELSCRDGVDPRILTVFEQLIMNHRRFLLEEPIACEAELIEQPTWGGTAILEKKGLRDDPVWRGKKVGQAFENHAQLPVRLPDGWTVSILDVSLVLGEPFLGPVAWRTVPAMGQLRKDTEAYGNSFQMHLAEPAWIDRAGRPTLLIPKSEAMRYLDKPGLLSCGLKCRTDAEWADYERRLRNIGAGMGELSSKVLAGRLDLLEAGRGARRLILDNNPYVWVNLLIPRPEEVVDFSTPRRHHNWEENNEATRELFAAAGFDLARLQGLDVNKLDEIQVGLYIDLAGTAVHQKPISLAEFAGLNLIRKRERVIVLTDDNSSIRGFDKGKFKADGSLRPLDVDTYFAYIDRRPEANIPERAIVKPDVRRLAEGTIRRYDFATGMYAFTVLETSKPNPGREFSRSFHGRFSAATDSYHHIYADRGPVLITFESGREPAELRQGYSVFLSGSMGEYGINPLAAGRSATVAVTYVPGDPAW
jgi:hypothetical protein